MRSKMFVAVAAVLVATGSVAADVKSVSRLAFGPDNGLFVADWTESRYTLAVFGNLEDASENRLNGHFESPSAAPEPADADVYIPLAIDRALVTHKRRLRIGGVLQLQLAIPMGNFGIAENYKPTVISIS